ncbi:phosphoglucosamine mutase, partial [Salmonella enterica subsp. enterica serovar Typhimurium]|nr:phosphoglucosamine mutase [Salmonella enterica subsp. enterica serovar Typhimurium]
GENSGHIIDLDRHTTGDGIVAALQVLAALQYQNVGLDQACAGLKLYPQKLVNVKLRPGFDWKAANSIDRARTEVEQELAQRGRVLLRPSGTEPLL